MKKKLGAVLLVVALVLSFGLVPAASVGASNSSPAWVEIETLTVDADDSVGETSTETLIDGWLYRFEVSGTYSASGPYEADAEYCTTDGWSSWSDDVPGYTWYGEGLLELMVDGSIVEWGPYESSHVYTLDYIGAGSTVSFLIYDLPPYSNNSGSLTVKIYATPVMVTTAITSGESTVSVGAEESWDIEITVEAKYADVCDVVVQDGMGADLDQIQLDGTSVEPGDGPVGVNTGTAELVKKGEGKKGANMVIWDVGDLAEDAPATLVVTVTTGFNAPRSHRFQPKHEFTSADPEHELDGGASATYTLCDAVVYKSPESVPLAVEVIDPPVLMLYEKDSSWDIVEGGAYGVMDYNFQGPTFDFYFEGYDLAATTDYSLIYYADPWPGDHPGALLGTGTSDGSGYVTISGSINFGGHLPDPADDNYPDGAKIWLVLSSHYNSTECEMTGWAPTQYLFEHNLINYYDTDAP